ncbi:SpoIIE family protein phosphatase [Algivirga pacifica]|uniref:Serine phosphatase RsbU, regulator of sigma subunit n=1 Tax=Algivirga pacifica TaxID=1162670 RepID=A0ABP9DJD5_9BACT
MRVFIFLTVLLFTTTAWSQQGQPILRNISPVEYHADGLNYDAVQDERGVMYFANEMGILEFDGKIWSLIPMKRQEAVLGMSKGRDGAIYAASAWDFGVLSTSSDNELYYRSLQADEFKMATHRGERITGVDAAGKGIYFFSNKRILYYQNGVLSQVKSLGDQDIIVDRYAVAHDRMFVRYREDGELLWKELLDGQFTDLFQLPVREVIRDILPAEGEDLLYVSSSGNWYWDHKGKVKRFRLPSEVVKGGMNAIIPLKGVYNYAVATKTAGLFILDEEGDIMVRLQKTTGLLSDDINQLYQDQQGGLWAMQFNGLTRIELSSPFLNWKNQEGEEVVALTFEEGGVYTASYGVEYYDNGDNIQIKGIDRLVKVWGMERITSGGVNRLYVNTEDGVYWLNRMKAEKCFANDRIISLHPSRYYENKVYGIDQGGRIYFLDISNHKKWKVVDAVDTGLEEVTGMAEDREGDLWVSSSFSGIRYIKVEQEDNSFLLHSPIVASLGQEVGKITVHEFGDEVLVSAKGYLFDVDAQNKTLTPSQHLLSKIIQEKNYRPKQILSTEEDYLLVPYNTVEHPIVLVDYHQESKTWEVKDEQMRLLPAMHINDAQFVDEGILIAGAEGVFFYNRTQEGLFSGTFKTLIRQVAVDGKELFNGAYRVPGTERNGNILVGQLKGQEPELKMENNDITFSFAAPVYSGQGQTEFQYQLKGHDNSWSEWTSSSKHTYANLKAGGYAFYVRAKDLYGNIGQEAVYRFHVQGAWYESYAAYFLYVFLLGGGMFAVVRWNTYLLKSRNQKLEEEVEQRTAELASQKNTIEKAYRDVQQIGDMGKKVMAALEKEDLVERLYYQLKEFMNVEAFGIGVYDEMYSRLSYSGFIEVDQSPRSFTDIVTSSDSIAGECLNENTVILIRDIKEKEKEGVEIKQYTIEKAKSMVFLPIVMEGKKLGVMTLQSFEPFAFGDIELQVLNTLVPYVTIALSNAGTYKTLKEKNLQMTDSIRYAETIQKAGLPSSELMRNILKDFFVLWKPKDIVSGDFYWFNVVDRVGYLAVVDCTGHGVPGAFMSMIGISTLNNLIYVNELSAPEEILEQMNDMIRMKLRQDEARNTDGMDMGLCKFEYQDDGSCKLTFSGAKTPLYYIQQGEFLEIKGTRRSIGGKQKKNKDPFVSHELLLSPGDTIYILTDGMADQHNGARKKIGTAKIKTLLSSINSQSMQEQKVYLEQFIEDYKGEEAPQRDDITVIGIRI